MMDGTKKRGKLEVIRDMLAIIRAHGNSIKPTPLLRLSNLSSEIFGKYFSELLEKYFVKEIKSDGETLITLTDKGFKYLENYKVITLFIEEFGL